MKLNVYKLKLDSDSQEHAVRAFSYLNCFKTLPRKHLVSLLRNERGLQARMGVNNTMHAMHEY